MKIFSAAFGPHDHNTYDGTWHNQRERYTRRKHNIPWHYDAYPHHTTVDKMNRQDNTSGQEFYNEYWNTEDDNIFAYTTTIGGVAQMPDLELKTEFMDWKPNNLWDYKKDGNIYYIDHHQSHAAYAYLNSGFDESDILAIDGRGYKYNTVFFDKNGTPHDLNLSIGELWDYFSKELGFGTLGASKVMGLVGYGKSRKILMKLYMLLDEFWSMEDRKDDIIWHRLWKIVQQENPRHIAYTLQQATQERIMDAVKKYKTSDNLCVTGGVAYNGYVNELLTEEWKNVFVPPAPGDEGQALGTYMHADYTLNNNVHIPDVYAGKEYDFVGDEKVDIKEVAQAIADGKIIGWFQGKSESGHRALGNRSILADPRNPRIKSIINHTIKEREDFRPFAPSVLEDHYQDYFDTKSPSPYMSRIVKVKSDKIPGVTHVDNTARIQTVNREQNEKFYDLINEFYKITGIPMLLNTSFNCQEPIVETPEEAISTFNRTEMDILVINDYIMRKMG